MGRVRGFAPPLNDGPAPQFTVGEGPETMGSSDTYDAAMVHPPAVTADLPTRLTGVDDRAG